MSQCIKCSSQIPEDRKSTKYCSGRCSKLYLKSQYKKRNPERVKAWKKTYYSEHGKKITQFMVKQTLERFGNKCFRCGWLSGLEVHHWKPYRYGGTNEAINLVPFCKRCHVALHEELRGDFWKLDEETERTELVGDGSIEDLEDMPPNPSDVLLYLEKEALRIWQ